ncbi:winged helix-turn-helix domain-containing protein [Sphingomonas sp.]|jgi:hypothetical protein|uniref:winged helix-turn-helix domain-containing protein n=1 Tax=Sphingomonas sp. TaxID=28214 RepID=UPI0035C83D65
MTTMHMAAHNGLHHHAVEAFGPNPGRMPVDEGDIDTVADEMVSQGVVLLHAAMRTFKAAGNGRDVASLRRGLADLLEQIEGHGWPRILPPLPMGSRGVGPATEARKDDDPAGPIQYVARRFLSLADRYGGGSDNLWRDLLTHQAASRLDGVRPAAARLLIRLLEYPGESVSTAALYDAAQTHSATTNIVKVYVSQLRAALRGIGIVNAIDTVHGDGYCIDHEKAELILAALA